MKCRHLGHEVDAQNASREAHPDTEITEIERFFDETAEFTD